MLDLQIELIRPNAVQQLQHGIDPLFDLRPELGIIGSGADLGLLAVSSG